METQGWDGWDSAQSTPPKTDSSSEAKNKWADTTAKILRVIAFIVIFCVVLASGVVAKGTILFMISQIKPARSVKNCSDDDESGGDWEYQAELPTTKRAVWTWCLFFAFVLPEFFTFFKIFKIRLNKSSSLSRPPLSDFFVVLVFESMHVVGLSLLIFVVLPELDVVKGAMITSCLCFIPAVLQLASRHSKESRRFLKVAMDLVAIAGLCTGFLVWPLAQTGREEGSYVTWTIPIASFLTSAGWWENYVDQRSSVPFVSQLGGIKERLKKTRHFVYFIVSIWKITLFFATMLLFLHLNGVAISPLFSLFTEGEGSSTHKINETRVLPQSNQPLPELPGGGKVQEMVGVTSWNFTPFIVLFIQIFSACLAYNSGKFACKICIQGFSFALPMVLTTPVVVSLLFAACGLREGDGCVLKGSLPDYLYWRCPGTDFLNDFDFNQHAWIWLVWFLSQTWVTIHIWSPQNERLASREKLFVTPLYLGLLIDQSLCMNRRRDDEGEVKAEELEQDSVGMEDPYYSPQIYETISSKSSQQTTAKAKSTDRITRIYACATMWHENKNEMMEMVKSLFRMDKDQSGRRENGQYSSVVDPDFYEFESHIFFDDAFEVSKEEEGGRKDWMQVNSFVKDFVDCIDEAGSNVYQTDIRLGPPKKMPTPYGGRLIYTLPGKTLMIIHMKDKAKIRHKKRWSQVMYMYYLLGLRLSGQPISRERKEVLAENTYLLTLDGDIDFQPQAVAHLVDLMKKNKNVGAACGRIHPVGSNLPIVWYQKFEYAIGHWLQKATEHMLGCVLCSPGCFSLFRAKALMDDNVMQKYTTMSTEASHYVQYDQGEDRWLSTLLLKRGYRLEYSAASDSYTHCPEEFNEFFNQRRRWIPSTMANIYDLLMDYKATVKINDNISLSYISYQFMLMFGTLIGPGMIFLMLVGACVAAFGIGNWTSFFCNLVPIVFYTAVCLKVKEPKWQLRVSFVLAHLYALVMMAVLAGTGLQLIEDGIGSPSAIFLISMVGSFFIAACLHPQEFWCIVHGIVYLLAIPSMYLLLIIYSITNLNVVSWGTREVVVKKSKKEIEAEEKEKAEMAKNKKEKGIWGFMKGCYEVLLSHKKENSKDREQLFRIANSLDNLTKRLDNLDKRLDNIENTVIGPQATSGPRSSRPSQRDEATRVVPEGGESVDMDAEEGASHTTEPMAERDDLLNPFWMEDKKLGKGIVDFLSDHEEQFWDDLIEKYLFPIDANKIDQENIKESLKKLRDKVFLWFVMPNSLFVTVVMMFTVHKDVLSVRWPLGVKQVKENITANGETHEMLVQEYLHLEPIGITLVFSFFVVVVIQFLAMCFHRFGTISHILASTDLWRKEEKEKEEKDKDKDKHKNKTKVTGDIVQRVSTPEDQGVDNQAFLDFDEKD